MLLWKVLFNLTLLIVNSGALPSYKSLDYDIVQLTKGDDPSTYPTCQQFDGETLALPPKPALISSGSPELNQPAYAFIDWNGISIANNQQGWTYKLARLGNNAQPTSYIVITNNGPYAHSDNAIEVTGSYKTGLGLLSPFNFFFSVQKGEKCSYKIDKPFDLDVQLKSMTVYFMS